MPGPLANLVLERANAPGTAATFNLGGAPSGWIGFVAGIGNGGTAYYYMSDGVQAEWGHGTVTAGALNSLARNVIGNTQGTTARLNFTGGVDVWCEVPAERTPFFNPANSLLPMGGRRLVTLGAGTDPDDGARLDQVGWRFLGAADIAAPQVSAIFSLPPALSRFRMEWVGLQPAAAGALGLVFSLDGGATFRANATDYDWALTETKGSSTGSYHADGAFMLYVGLSNASFNLGFAEFTPFRQVVSQNQTATGSPATVSASFGGGVSRFGGTATHAALLFGGTNMIAGRVRLLGGT